MTNTNNSTASNKTNHHVVIIGGGFGGLYAAQQLGKSPVSVTLIDKRNFHLFQPLLYQVATGGLSPGDIASPLRAVLNRQKNTRVIRGEVVDIDPAQQVVFTADKSIPYDSLIIATGAHHHYFGNDEWEEHAPGLKTIEDALELRRRIFSAFEKAELETDPAKRAALMTFVVVGGGPTGVELAGALAELAHFTLKNDFRKIDPNEARIFLLEGGQQILPSYPKKLSQKACKSLQKLNVVVRTETLVTGIEKDTIFVESGERTDAISASTTLWAAGVKASGLSKIVAEKTGVETDRMGRLVVESDLSIRGFPNILVIGDLANFSHQTGEPLPGVAQVAIQQGRHVAKLIKNRLRQKKTPPFRYFDKGNLAVIGRNAAVADIGAFKLSGWFAWFIWIFVHIAYLVEFDNRVLVMFQWAWNYFTRKRGARLITNDDVPSETQAAGAKQAESAY